MYDNIIMGFKLMGLGLAGVFAVLIIFYIILKVLMKVFKNDDAQ